MCKKLKSNDLQREISRSLLAVSLIATLAVFGCSTNRNPGNGQPYTGGPSWGQSAPSSTPGSSSGTSGVPPSMTSSSTLSTNDAALAILAEHQLQPRILGTIPPDAGGARIISNQPTGQWINPALVTNPQSTVNSSASSAPTPVIISGAGADVSGTAIDSAAILGATIPNVASNTAAAIIGNGTLLTPVTAASTLVPGAFAAGPSVATSSATPTAAATTTTLNSSTLTPTISSGAVTSATVASSPLISMTSASNTGETLRPITIGGSLATTASSTTTSTASGAIAPLRVVRSANGTIVITNVTDAGARARHAAETRP